MKELIDISDLSKSYVLGSGKVNALSKVDLKFNSGGIIALMGPSGSGKSTLLNLIGGLDTPTTGKIYINGSDISEYDKDRKATFRNKTVGFVFQNFNLVPVLTTLENVLLPAQLGKLEQNSAEIEQRARDLLQKVGLQDQTDQGVNRLSGGQMQRVSIARALINHPPIVLADEPTANLDHKTSEKIMLLLKDLCTSENTTIIIATHDPSVLDYCDRVITLKDGQLISDKNK